MLLFELTKDTPYLALSGEIWSVFYEYFNRNWSCYKGFLLYVLPINNENALYAQVYGSLRILAFPVYPHIYIVHLLKQSNNDNSWPICA